VITFPKNKATDILRSYKFLLVVYLCATLFSVWGRFAKKVHNDSYTDYNNYILFRESFHHLVNGIDLYKNHEKEHFDLYKYSPAFAALMAPFTWFLDAPGLMLWNLINALALFFGIYHLPGIHRRAKILMLWFILIELVTNLQNCQSNGLIAGLLVGAFIQFEKKNVVLASLFIVLCAYIKIFGIAAVLLGLLYPDKIKFAISSLIWMIVFAFLPLFFTSPELLMMQYKSWYNVVAHDYSMSYGISLFGIMHSWFQAEFSKNIVLISGLIILLTSFSITRRYKEYDFRLSLFSSLLVWLIIFNPRAESPTYIIATTGIAIWFFSGKRNTLDLVLICFAFILTSLSSTAFFPRSVRTEFVISYALKALPCLLIWVKINYDLLLKKKPAGNSILTFSNQVLR
jgi:hypothetical protein